MTEISDLYSKKLDSLLKERDDASLRLDNFAKLNLVEIAIDEVLDLMEKAIGQSYRSGLVNPPGIIDMGYHEKAKKILNCLRENISGQYISFNDKKGD